jgi:hypothetical protein
MPMTWRSDGKSPAGETPGLLRVVLELKHNCLDLVLGEQTPFEQDTAEEAVFAAVQVVLDLIHDRRLHFVDGHEPLEYSNRPKAVTTAAGNIRVALSSSGAIHHGIPHGRELGLPTPGQAVHPVPQQYLEAQRRRQNACPTRQAPLLQRLLMALFTVTHGRNTEGLLPVMTDSA